MISPVPESDLFDNVVLAAGHRLPRRPHHLPPEISLLLKLLQRHLLKESSSVEVDPLLVVGHQVVEEALQARILSFIETFAL